MAVTTGSLRVARATGTLRLGRITRTLRLARTTGPSRVARQAGERRGFDRLVRTAVLALVLAAGVLLGAPPARAAALFDDSAELALVIDLPVPQLLRTKARREPIPATLHWLAPEGGTASMPIRVRARGHKRLEACDFPPLRLEFDAAAAAGTPFAGQKSLKLVTQCRAERRYAEYVKLEQRLYRAWELVAPIAFRTRTVAATYLDTTSTAMLIRGPAFLIEDFDDVAKRAGLSKAKVPALEPAQLDPANAALVEMFAFMAGNTDFSLHRSMEGEKNCCHNDRVLGPVPATGRHVAVPYDFDQAGLINADYAAVSPVVGVRHVRTRIWRGVCSRNASVPGAIERMQQLRPQIEALFREPQLADWAVDRASRYVSEFYAILADPALVKAKIYDFCRPDPDPFLPPSPAASAPAAAPSAAGSRGRLP